MSDSFSFPVKPEHLSDIQKIIDEFNEEVMLDLSALKKVKIIFPVEELLFNDIPYNSNYSGDLLGVNLSAVHSGNESYRYYIQKINQFAKKYGVHEQPHFINYPVPVIYYDDQKNFILPNDKVAELRRKCFEHINIRHICRENVFENDYTLQERTLITRFLSKVKQKNYDKIYSVIKK